MSANLLNKTLVNLLDMIPLIGIVIAVFVFAKILEQILLVSNPRHFDKNLPVGGLAVV